MRQDQPFIWKSSFDRPISWVGQVSLGISKLHQTVLARLMESQIRHPHSGSGALSGEGSEKGRWPLSAFLSGRGLSPSSHLHSRHFTSSLYATGIFQAATLVLEIIESESEEVHM